MSFRCAVVTPWLAGWSGHWGLRWHDSVLLCLLIPRLVSEGRNLPLLCLGRSADPVWPWAIAQPSAWLGLLSARVICIRKYAKAADLHLATPAPPSRGVNGFVAFFVLVVIVAAVMLYREEIGLMTRLRLDVRDPMVRILVATRRRLTLAKPPWDDPLFEVTSYPKIKTLRGTREMDEAISEQVLAEVSAPRWTTMTATDPPVLQGQEHHVESRVKREPNSPARVQSG